MDITIYPKKLNGTIHAISSKSQAHRLLICAAFSDKPTTLLCHTTNQDIEATAECLRSIGAHILRHDNGYVVTPIKRIPRTAEMDCGESGSTLRFLLPIVCALGIQASITMHGRLPYRPLSPLWEELERMGCSLSRPTANTIQTSGKLQQGNYTIAGNVSSQFISGLMFAMALIEGESKLQITGKLESRPYIEMTQQALTLFGVDTANNVICGSVPFHSPGICHVEGDWSNGAFFLTAKALGSPLVVNGLNHNATQGDRAITDILSTDKQFPRICVADTPDLVPILAIYFAATHGVTFTDIGRLRLKESDRVASVLNMLSNLGILATAESNSMTVYPGKLMGGVVNACGDHRIAMAAAIAATVAEGPVTILGADCVAKSYPTFWQDYKYLGGDYEQYIR